MNLKKQKNYTLNFSIMYFINYAVYALINSQRKTFLIETGYAVEQIALIYALMPLVTISLQLLIGHLSDRFRTVKKIITILVVLSATVSYLFYSIQVQYFVFHLGLSLLSYALAYSVTEFSDVWVMESPSPSNKNYGFIRAFGSAGWAFGSFLLANILIIYGFSGLALTVLFISILLLAVMLTISDDNRGATHSHDVLKFKDISDLFKDKYYLLTILIVFFVNLAINMSSYILIDKVLFLGGTAFIISMREMVAASSEIPLMLIGDKIHQKLGSLQMIIIGVSVFVLQFLGYYFATSNTMLIMITAGQFISLPFFNIALKYLLKEMSPDHLKTTGQLTGPALVNGTTSFLYPIISAILMSSFSVNAPFLLSALSASIGIILAIILSRIYKK